MRDIWKIIIQAIPIIIMIGLIPVIQNDYFLTLVYAAIIFGAFIIKKEKGEIKILIFGFIIMIVSEYFLVSTGVEIFARRTLLGLMPLWLPFLWAYAFVVIKRSVLILEK